MSEPNTDKPKPGRRTVKRLLIAILSLGLLIGAGSWLTRPRIDQRFVGSWSGHQVVDGTELNPFTIEFDDGGNVTKTSYGQPQTLLWRIKDGRLELTHQRTFVSRFGRTLVHLFRGTASSTSDYSLRISEVSADSIVLDWGVVNGKDLGWHLRRAEQGVHETPSPPTEVSPTPNSTNSADGVE
jgi:hypothetical protein